MSTQSRIDAEARKDPETLEREIDQKRSDIGHLVDALESKLSPGQLIDQALQVAKGNGGEFFGNLGNTLKANPVPTVLTSVGLIWLMLGQNRVAPARAHPEGYAAGLGQRPSGVGERLQGARQQLNSAAQSLQDKAGQVQHGVASSLSHTGQRLESGMHDASEALHRQGENLKSGLQQMLHEQPLALAAMGVALGAVVGAALPPTRTENRLLGETGDRLTGKARDIGSAGLQQTRAMASELLDDARQTARSTDSGTSRVPSPGDNLSGELGRL